MLRIGFLDRDSHYWSCFYRCHCCCCCFFFGFYYRVIYEHCANLLHLQLDKCVNGNRMDGRPEIEREKAYRTQTHTRTHSNIRMISVGETRKNECGCVCFSVIFKILIEDTRIWLAFLSPSKLQCVRTASAGADTIGENIRSIMSQQWNYTHILRQMCCALCIQNQIVRFDDTFVARDSGLCGRGCVHKVIAYIWITNPILSPSAAIAVALNFSP